MAGKYSHRYEICWKKCWDARQIGGAWQIGHIRYNKSSLIKEVPVEGNGHVLKTMATCSVPVELLNLFGDPPCCEGL